MALSEKAYLSEFAIWKLFSATISKPEELNWNYSD